ncbi:DUF72 domain-containing protein [Caenimonas terrae]|uniref:DUF72 domain-containing protein n=1 Tax=Caenimonas terrae TaxID=696074 RepID=A0ABW0NIL6_9BURK
MDLFDDQGPAPAPALTPRPRPSQSRIEAAVCAPDLIALGAALPAGLHLGTSSWSFPGWRGLVWRGDHSESSLSRTGLTAYSGHPLLRCVSLDRSFYRPLTASQYAAYAGQVPDHFRFVVKAPSLVCDALVRGKAGRGLQDNPAFLDPVPAAAEFVQPALDGLGPKIGALVFQLSPLPPAWLARLDEVLERLAAMLAALPALQPVAPGAVVAVEVRNPEFLTPAFAAILKAAGATYCLGLHPRMPPVDEQLPMLRALWPAPLVCRWSLNGRHGAYGYEDAKGLYEPFDRLQDPDPATRKTLARVIAATTGAALPVYITVNNKAEGSAPLSVLELARAVHEIGAPEPET